MSLLHVLVAHKYSPFSRCVRAANLVYRDVDIFWTPVIIFKQFLCSFTVIGHKFQAVLHILTVFIMWWHCFSLRMVKEFAAVNNTVQIRKLLKVLGQDFATSQNTNTKKGGLIGLAATAVALGKVWQLMFLITMNCNSVMYKSQQHSLSRARFCNINNIYLLVITWVYPHTDLSYRSKIWEWQMKTISFWHELLWSL